MREFIPYGRQSIDQSDIEAVIETLKSDWLTTGPKVSEFEQVMAQYTGAKYAIAVSNATAALHIAGLALGLKEGKELWTSPNTFVASANCGLYCGAKVDFVDIDPDSYNLSVESLKEKLKIKTPDVLVPVHFAGNSCDMKEIYQLAQQYGFSIIEDASHAVGGEYEGLKVGNCQYSDITVMSFHPVKIMTSGEGGICLTNNPELAEILLALRSHGIVRDERLLEDKNQGSWYYEQKWLGYNYRITDIQCALGISQLKRVEEFVTVRRELVEQYNELLEGLELKLPQESSQSKSSWHLYPIQLLKNENGYRKKVYDSLREAQIGVNVHYIPVHMQPYYRKLGFKVGDFPVAEKYYNSAISLPMYYGLSNEDVNYVTKTLKNIL
ncbi:MAG: UDP-4-amino-4,6-dideoxy-N-acetyl-beta-L-altrosamine transaminase [Bdellovibrionales bacterium]|nr:UDP-4-amino-4,6-dideoxy-N-acetyl-beta-L-altrosamine transaminase [Bdellovibrionales bacterium]